ncbi:hypothetical protein ACFQI7_05155 [Paenibacillus allorhizosphaerae]|nr:hypothetical protein [Paenibacillus allorhizosphaerae]
MDAARERRLLTWQAEATLGNERDGTAVPFFCRLRVYGFRLRRIRK